MNRHLFLSLLLALFASSTLSADNLKIEPAFWWSGMKNPELQLMVYGKDIAGYLPSVKYPGVQLKSSVALESPNYLLIYLDVEKAKPGRFDITFTKDKKSFNYSYELKARKPNADRIKGLTLPTCFISSCRIVSRTEIPRTIKSRCVPLIR